MNIPAQIEQQSTKHFLTRLGSAIDEAKLVRLTIKSNNLMTKTEPNETVYRRLMLVNREIELLESKLVRVRCRVSGG